MQALCRPQGPVQQQQAAQELERQRDHAEGEVDGQIVARRHAHALQVGRLRGGGPDRQPPVLADLHTGGGCDLISRVELLRSCISCGSELRMHSERVIMLASYIGARAMELDKCISWGHERVNLCGDPGIRSYRTFTGLPQEIGRTFSMHPHKSGAAHTWRERSAVAAANMTIGTMRKGLHADRYCQYTFLSTLPSARASLCHRRTHNQSDPHHPDW